MREYAAWYRDMLGFTIDFLWPTPEESLDGPTFGVVRHGSDPGITIEFSSTACNAADHDHPEYRACFVLETQGVMSLYSHVRDKVKTLWGPEVYHYGCREVALEDPGGHMVILSEKTDDPVTCRERG